MAAALLGDPPVLMLDEPMDGLDPEGMAWMRELLRSLADQGRTVLVSSHLMSEMQQLADHLVVIGQGRLVAGTTVADLVATAGQRVRLRTPQPDRLAGLLREAGAELDQDGDGLSVAGLAAAEIGELAAVHGIPTHELTSYADLDRLTGDLPTAPSPQIRTAAPVPVSAVVGWVAGLPVGCVVMLVVSIVAIAT